MSSSPSVPRVIYQERQWVPWSWWIFGAFIVALTTAQLAHNRSVVWLVVPAVVLSAVAVWSLLSLSSTRVVVEVDADGCRWLKTGGAELPCDVVSRTLAVPATAKRNAMGHQLDPAAFVVSHGWVNEMAMFVLDDPEDPTPYWLIGSRDPQALIAAFVGPDEAGSSAG
ncbi:membrane protein [Corynebacterium aquilae DSM 44791]|uniref:Membrane protein n=1 Tax=Corynebacterium aquilae DSM 44791 TaxID=1431546 RepID=A0A1L7CGA0_9CORY|nr:membrane protein [Corynebacterium aquilae DSM 44791]